MRLTGLRKWRKTFLKIDVVEGAGRVGALYPNKVPAQNAHLDLVSEGDLPHVLVGREGVPPDRRDPKVRPVDGHEAIVAHVSFFSSIEVDLRWWREVGRKGGWG